MGVETEHSTNLLNEESFLIPSVKRTGLIFCSCCNLVLLSKNIAKHRASELHQNHAKQNHLSCEVCRVRIACSPSALSEHIESEAHRAAMKIAAADASSESFSPSTPTQQVPQSKSVSAKPATPASKPKSYNCNICKSVSFETKKSLQQHQTTSTLHIKKVKAKAKETERLRKLFANLPRLVAAKADAKPSRCRSCNEANPSLICNCCHWAKYCDQDCQKRHWLDEHQDDCATSDPCLKKIAFAVGFRASVAARNYMNPVTWNFKSQFRCANGHTWSSHKAAVAINWKSMCIKQIFQQKCIQCEELVRPKKADLADFRETLTNCFRYLTGEDVTSSSRNQQEGSVRPHNPSLCGRCGFGSTPHSH